MGCKIQIAFAWALYCARELRHSAHALLLIHSTLYDACLDMHT